MSAKSCRACEVLRGGGVEADDSADDAAAARAAAAAEAARTCAICLDSVDLRDVKFDVRCGHKFHPACLQEYIAKYDAGEVVLDSTHPGAVCPVCRERLIVDLAPPWRTWFAPRPLPCERSKACITRHLKTGRGKRGGEWKGEARLLWWDMERCAVRRVL